MNKEYINIIKASLPALGQEIQDYVLMGYRLAEGYPMELGWQYHVVLEREVVEEKPVEDKPKAGRPKTKVD